MRRKILALLVVAGLALAVLSCSGEPKPDHKGVFIVVGDQVRELKPVNVDTEFTDEGFAIMSFAKSPEMTVKLGKFYFILNGDYRPVGLKAFAHRGNRWEEDSSKGDLTSLLESGGMAGEKEMFKAKIIGDLKSGTYALQVQQGGSAVLYFPFSVELH
ncbi:MAG: hypothetical protein ACM3O7_03125 [Acidobacteriota bacterium]